MPGAAKQDPVDVEIGAKVHDYLWRNRLPQSAMAPLLGMSQQSLGRKLRGDSAWTAGELHRLARLLGVSVGWFYGETSEEPVRPKGLEPLTFWSVLCEHDEDDECSECGAYPATAPGGLCWECFTRDDYPPIDVRTDDLALAA